MIDNKIINQIGFLKKLIKMYLVININFVKKTVGLKFSSNEGFKISSWKWKEPKK